VKSIDGSASARIVGPLVHATASAQHPTVITSRMNVFCNMVPLSALPE
jgi:hypothetical protein